MRTSKYLIRATTSAYIPGSQVEDIHLITLSHDASDLITILSKIKARLKQQKIDDYWFEMDISGEEPSFIFHADMGDVMKINDYLFGTSLRHAWHVRYPNVGIYPTYMWENETLMQYKTSKLQDVTRRIIASENSQLEVCPICSQLYVVCKYRYFCSQNCEEEAATRYADKKYPYDYVHKPAH